jgi:hypothetical protein
MMVQDKLYAVLVEHNEPSAQINQGLFVVGDRSNGKWHEHPTLITQASKDAALWRAYHMIRDQILGTWNYTPLDGFGKRGWHCKPQYCGVWDKCEARKTGDEFENMPQETRSEWM